MINVGQIHQCNSGEIPFFRTGINYLATGGQISFLDAQNHYWREFNKRAYLFGLTGQMNAPYDAGFRPTGDRLP